MSQLHSSLDTMQRKVVYTPGRQNNNLNYRSLLPGNIRVGQLMVENRSGKSESGLRPY